MYPSISAYNCHHICADVQCSFRKVVLGKKLSHDDVTFKTIYLFLDWHISQKTSPDGIAKRGMKKRSSLVTFWCTFRLAFERSMGFKVDEKVDRGRVSNV